MSASPFKFLDAYDAADRDRFFGREREVEALYALMLRDDLVLVYGPSGTGKTSLIQCGLAAKFRDVDRVLVPVRRRDDLNASLRAALARAGRTPIPADATIPAAVRSVFLDALRPVHLVFDQFEELLLLGGGEERRRFFTDLQALLATPGACKVLISMREEYFALLSGFEDIVPQLFASRLRVEPMTRATLVEVVVRTAQAYGIGLEHGADTAARIVARLGADPRGAFQLPYLQVYLDRLYRTAAASGKPVVFTDALVDATGGLDDVMTRFLDDQVAAVRHDLAERHPRAAPDAPRRFLDAFVTDEGTRRPVARAEVASATGLPDDVARDALAGFERGRIIRVDEDGGCELAHDSLARAIDERRGADRKQLARLAKLVRDALAKRGQVKSPWLTREELALVRPRLSLLDLSAEDTAFVAESRSRRLRSLRIGFGAMAAVIVALVLLSLSAWRSAEHARATIASAENGLNTLTRSVYFDLRALPQTDEIRRSTMHLAGNLNGDLVAGRPAADERRKFWQAIEESDRLYDGNKMARARMGFDEAIYDAEAVLKAAPRDPTWRTNLVVALDRAARIRTLDDATAATMTTSEVLERELALQNRARALIGRARREAAALEREKPGDADRRLLHATMMMQAGVIEGDEGHWPAARALFAQVDRRYRALLARRRTAALLRYAGALEAARARLAADQMAALHPTPQGPLLAEARARYARARALYREQIDRQTIDTLARHNLSRVYREEADLEAGAGNARLARTLCLAGRAELDRIIALDPRGKAEDRSTALARDDLQSFGDCAGAS